MVLVLFPCLQYVAKIYNLVQNKISDNNVNNCNKNDARE